MRAFTVAPWAIQKGAEKIVLVESPEDALRLKAETPESLAFADWPMQEEFDLFNSPVELLELDVAGRTIFQRTSAGTRAAIAAAHCQPLICAGFVCASATAKFIGELSDRDVVYVISGLDGSAQEDLACAHFIDALTDDPTTDPTPFVAEAYRSKAAEELRLAINQGKAGVHPRDIEMCLDVDTLDFCLIASIEKAGLTLRKVTPRSALGRQRPLTIVSAQGPLSGAYRSFRNDFSKSKI